MKRLRTTNAFSALMRFPLNMKYAKVMLVINTGVR